MLRQMLQTKAPLRSAPIRPVPWFWQSWIFLGIKFISDVECENPLKELSM